MAEICMKSITKYGDIKLRPEGMLAMGEEEEGWRRWVWGGGEVKFGGGRDNE